MALHLIDDSNWQTASLPPTGYSKGMEPRATHAKFAGYGSAPFAAKTTRKPYPRSEWSDRIAQKNRDKSWARNIFQDCGGKSKDQNGTNYCWNFGVVGAVEMNLAAMGMPYAPLSPAFSACQIKSFRNQGGWGMDAIEWGVEHGWCLASIWPQAAINRKYLTEEAKADALKRRVTEWDELPENSFDHAISAAIDNICFGIGLDWWGHLVCGGTHAVDLGGGKFALGCLNSWGSDYGNQGFFELSESRARGDMVAPRVSTAVAP